MKNIFLVAILFQSMIATAQMPESPQVAPVSPMRAFYKSKITPASATDKITPQKWDALFGIVDSQKADVGRVLSLDSTNWKLTGNTGNASQYRLAVNVPRKVGMSEMTYSMIMGFNIDSTNTANANYGYMRLSKSGSLSIYGQRQNSDASKHTPVIELSGSLIRNSVNWVSGQRYQFAESVILNGEISGFQHRIIAKDGVTQLFHGIVFGQGLSAIQTGTSQIWMSGAGTYQNKGSIFIDGETGVAYLKRREGNGIETYNRIVSNRTYTPTSTGDTVGEVGDTAQDDNYWYTKTAAGWKRIYLGSF